MASGLLPNGNRYKAVAGSMERLRTQVRGDLEAAGYESYALVTTIAPMTYNDLFQTDMGPDVSGGGSSAHSGAKGGGDHMTGHMEDKSTMPCDMYGNGVAAKDTMRPK